ncbi:MAG: response regulator [Spirochaetes bacterium]|nr:response regulator [Spirochaetota bacterium]MCK5268598.1 response regulator [Spirochaetota bacterium]
MTKILIVDDKEENRYVLVNFFKLFGVRSGIEIIQAKSGLEAVEKTKLEKPDLVLMDINMETPDAGLEAAKKIRRIEKIKDTKIWAVTAQAMEAYDDEMSDMEKCISAGCNKYISKPIDTVDLIKKVSEELNIEIPEKTKLRMGIK